MRITFVLPSHYVKPAGGPKIVYEYANRLARRGHLISVIHPQTMKIQIDRFEERCIVFIKYWLRKAGIKGGFNPSKWFAVDPAVNLLWVPLLAERFIPEADIIVATYWQTAEEVAAMTDRRGIKYYLIQHDERVFVNISKERVAKTWILPLNKIVVAKWLIDIVRGDANSIAYIPNGLNFDDFGIDVPIPQRRPHTVIMLYHPLSFKGSILGLQALDRVKKEIPGLSAVVFGVDRRPKEIPSWIDYYQNPKQKTLRSLYNNAAIYLGPSLYEGWGLTGSEAAQCGATLCMTDVGGHREFAIHKKTALLCPPGDPNALANNLKTLIKNNTMRIKLAEASQQYVKRFEWTNSINAIENLFKMSLLEYNNRLR